MVAKGEAQGVYPANEYVDNVPTCVGGCALRVPPTITVTDGPPARKYNG